MPAMIPGAWQLNSLNNGDTLVPPHQRPLLQIYGEATAEFSSTATKQKGKPQGICPESYQVR